MYSEMKKHFLSLIKVTLALYAGRGGLCFMEKNGEEWRQLLAGCSVGVAKRLAASRELSPSLAAAIKTSHTGIEDGQVRISI